MTMAADKQDKVLNVPNNGEQCKTCLNSAERKGFRLKGNVPTLRFPEFSGEWNVKRLGDDCEIQMCKRIFANQTNVDGDVPFYKIGTIGGKADAFISKKLYQEYKERYNYPMQGEVMITCAGTVGKTIIYDGEDAYFQDSNIVWISNPKQFYTNDFLSLLLSRINWSKLNATTIIRIYNDNLRELKIIYPTKEEQDKISSLLNLIDNRIVTQNRIIDKLQSLMKGLAEHLTAFTPNTKIADCLNCHSSILQENQVKNEGKYKVYGANGICGYNDSPAILEDAILIVKDGSGVGNVSYASGEYSVIGTSNYLTAKSGYSLKYLYFCLMIFNFVPYRTGMAIPHIYFKDYGKALIPCPSLNRQKQIATLLSKIECKIETEKTITESYLQQKRFLLKSMFI